MLLEKFCQKRILLEKSDLKPTNSAAGTLPYDSKDISSCHSGGSYWPPQAPYALSRQVHNQTSRLYQSIFSSKWSAPLWLFLRFFVRKVSKRRITILYVPTKQIRKNKLLLLCQLLNWHKIEPLFFLIFYLLVPQIKIFLNYFLNKNSKKQP